MSNFTAADAIKLGEPAIDQEYNEIIKEIKDVAQDPKILNKVVNVYKSINMAVIDRLRAGGFKVYINPEFGGRGSTLSYSVSWGEPVYEHKVSMAGSTNYGMDGQSFHDK